MEAARDTRPVVSGEGITVPVGWRADPITPSWLTGSLEKRGWKLESFELGELEARFVDGAQAGPLPDPPIQLEGMPGVGSLPAIGFARMASDFLVFKRKKLSLQVVVTETGDSWAQQWATYILEMGEQKSTSFGTGAVSEQGVVLGNGDMLINATWWVDGMTLNPVELSKYADSPMEELVSLGPGGA